MNAKSTYTEDDILGCWDQCVRKHRFVILDGGEEVPGDVRMTVYRDQARWATILEQLVFYPPSPGHRGIIDFLYITGNCIAGAAGCALVQDLSTTSDAPNEQAFLPPYELHVNPEVRRIRIRERIVPVDISALSLSTKGIPVSKEGIMRGQHLLWSLLPEYRDVLLANETEKRQYLPSDLPPFMTLDEWHHPPFLTERILPSQTETFRLIAEAIVTGDVRRYRPSGDSNTHWRNWLKYERI